MTHKVGWQHFDINIEPYLYWVDTDALTLGNILSETKTLVFSSQSSADHEMINQMYGDGGINLLLGNVFPVSSTS